MKRTSKAYKICMVFNYLFMICLSLIIIFPYLNVIAKAFNEGVDTSLGGVTIFPRVPTLANFKTLFENPSIGSASRVTIIRVFSGVLVGLLVQFTAAYALSRKELRYKKFFHVFLMIPMYFGGGLIPQYILYSNMHLLNNILVYILPTAFSFYNMVIIRTYMYTIPDSLSEAAKLDGANEFTIFAKIIMPLCKPILATIVLWLAVGHWNDWTTTLYFVTRQDLYTMQYVLMKVLKEAEEISKMLQEAVQSGGNVNINLDNAATPEAVQAAQIVLTTIPIVIVYPFLQKYFIKGVMLGAVKE
ncbi:MAG: carbohydrate ABC transporter permease [Clostridia bacterium]|nr:carbohydrate ABC transporter permease [Clostridia bacterium]